MKIPTSVKVAGVWYPIISTPNLLTENECYGRTLHYKSKIEYDADLSSDMKEVTCLHEILEIIKEENQLKMSHRALQTLATQIHQVIIDNPEMFR